MVVVAQVVHLAVELETIVAEEQVTEGEITVN